MEKDEAMNIDPWTIGTSLEDEIAALKEALRDNEVEIHKLRKENKELRCKYTAQMAMYKHLYGDNLPLQNKEPKDVPGIHIENIYITNYKIDPTRTDEEDDE